MADEKISQMALAGALTGVEMIPGVQAGGNVRTSPDQIREYVNSSSMLTIATGGPTLNLDFFDRVSLAFKGNAIIAGNKAVAINNDTNAIEIKFFRFAVDQAGRQLTFGSDVRHQDWDMNWDSPTGFVWTTPAAGSYDLVATKADNIWQVRIYGTF